MSGVANMDGRHYAVMTLRAEIMMFPTRCELHTHVSHVTLVSHDHVMCVSSHDLCFSVHSLNAFHKSVYWCKSCFVFFSSKLLWLLVCVCVCVCVHLCVHVSVCVCVCIVQCWLFCAYTNVAYINYTCIVFMINCWRLSVFAMYWASLSVGCVPAWAVYRVTLGIGVCMWGWYDVALWSV